VEEVKVLLQKPQQQPLLLLQSPMLRKKNNNFLIFGNKELGCGYSVAHFFDKKWKRRSGAAFILVALITGFPDRLYFFLYI
jgi:hypothetical protein